MSIDGRPEIKAKLIVDTDVLSLIGTYLTKPAIYTVPVAPVKFDEGCLTMYQSSPVDGGLELSTYRNTVNCFTTDYDTAEQLQEAVYQALNRKSEGSDTFFKCSKLNIIPALETGEDYNAPVEVLVRKR